MVTPDTATLVERLCGLVSRGTIHLELDEQPWLSGVYGLVDCVFSARSNYDTMVTPLLQRLDGRPDLQDKIGLRFSTFIGDVDSMGSRAFETYAERVLNRQQLSGRLKVQVCYEAACFFRDRSFETREDLRGLGDRALESLILGEFRASIRGIGEALARYLLIQLGLESHIKPDRMIIRFFTRLSEGRWKPSSGAADAEYLREIVIKAAALCGTVPARLDHAIWIYERGQLNHSTPSPGFPLIDADISHSDYSPLNGSGKPTAITPDRVGKEFSKSTSGGALKWSRWDHKKKRSQGRSNVYVIELLPTPIDQYVLHVNSEILRESHETPRYFYYLVEAKEQAQLIERR